MPKNIIALMLKDAKMINYTNNKYFPDIYSFYGISCLLEGISPEVVRFQYAANSVTEKDLYFSYVQLSEDEQEAVRAKRTEFFDEELREYKEAVDNGNYIEMLDGILDCLYLLLGDLCIFTNYAYIFSKECHMGYECSDTDYSYILDKIAKIQKMYQITPFSYTLIKDGLTEVARSNGTKFTEEGLLLLNGLNTDYDPSIVLGKVIKPDTYEKPNLQKVVDENKEERVALFIDIDSTLSDPKDRLSFITNGNKNYDYFYSLVHTDPPLLQNIKQVKEAISLSESSREGEIFIWKDADTLIFVSGRRETTLEKTTVFINSQFYNGDNDIIIKLREDGDRSSQVKYKSKWYKHYSMFFTIKCFFEDEPDVVEALKDLGGNYVELPQMVRSLE